MFLHGLQSIDGAHSWVQTGTEMYTEGTQPHVLEKQASDYMRLAVLVLAGIVVAVSMSASIATETCSLG